MIDEEDRDDERDDEASTVDAPDDAELSEAEIEAKARKQGWRPESEWDDARAEREGRRKPARFMSAQEFLDRIDQELPMMRERHRRETQRGDRLEKELKEVKTQLTEVGQLLKTQHDQSKEAKKRAYDKGIADEKARQRQAVEEGDTKAYDAAQSKIEAMQAEKEEIDKTVKPSKDDDGQADEGDRRQKPELDDETKAWIAANKNWFQVQPTITNYMIEMNSDVRRERPGLSITEQLEEAKKRVMEKFPEKFGKNPNRGGNGAVTTPSGGERGSKDSTAKRFDQLPAADKATYERYRKQFKASHKHDYTKEEYLADYHD